MWIAAYHLKLSWSDDPRSVSPMFNMMRSKESNEEQTTNRITEKENREPRVSLSDLSMAVHVFHT
jgi:hypothetical protein